MLNPIEDDSLPPNMDGKEFKAIRERLGLTQAQLAVLLGYGRPLRISDFERETNPRAIPLHVAMLMTAFENGYRPSDWPGR